MHTPVDFDFHNPYGDNPALRKRLKAAARRRLPLKGLTPLDYFQMMHKSRI